MDDNLINSSINSLTNFIKNLDLNIKNNKSKILLGFLLIIKKIYGHTIIFDFICTLYTVIVLLYITNDIDKGNNIMANTSIKKYGIIGIITYFIANTQIISQNTNFGNGIKQIMIMLTNTIKNTITTNNN
jgi:hypothetical protein